MAAQKEAGHGIELLSLDEYEKCGFDEVLFEGADEAGEYYKLLKRI